MSDSVSSLIEAWGHPALLVLLLLTGIGSPVPEDLLLVTAGYLASADVLDWRLTAGLGWLGVVGSDLLLWAAGRRLAWHAARWQDGHFLSPHRLRRATGWFDRWGNAVILIARLVPGTRAVVFLTAGVRDVSPRTFLVYDGAGAMLWVPAMLALGSAAADHLAGPAGVAEVLGRGTGWMFVVVAALALAWLVMGREESKL